MRRMIELENKFFENLQHQIKIKKLEQFKKKIPSYQEQLHDAQEAVQELREKFNEIRIRDAYREMIDQLDDLVNNK